MITPQQKNFFDIFGYLALPGAIKADVGWIIEEFEAVWRKHLDHGHTGAARTTLPVNMIATTEKLTTLLVNPVIADICDSLLGPGWSFQGGDGNLYSGDTGWHSDCHPEDWQPKSVCRHLKIAFYLDPLTRSTGALRVIPGSHHFGDRFCDVVTKGLHGDPDHDLGIEGKDVPCVALDNQPGDLAVFDHRIKHASFGGADRRRMFTMNIFAPPRDQREREAAMAVMRFYRDRDKVDWLKRENWIDWYDSMTPGQRRRMDTTVELGTAIMNEVAVPASH